MIYKLKVISRREAGCPIGQKQVTWLVVALLSFTFPRVTRSDWPHHLELHSDNSEDNGEILPGVMFACNTFHRYVLPSSLSCSRA